MRIYGICGSPRPRGNTYDAISFLAEQMAGDSGCVTVEDLCDKQIADCTGCGTCRTTRTCEILDDAHHVYDRAKEAEVIIIGSPVYGGSITGTLKNLLDRFCWWSSSDNRSLEGKIGIPVVTGRRAGHNAVHAEIMMWMHIRGFIMVGSTYWNICVCGREEGSIHQDEEFLRHGRHLATNVRNLYDKLGPIV